MDCLQKEEQTCEHKEEIILSKWILCNESNCTSIYENAPFDSVAAL